MNSDSVVNVGDVLRMKKKHPCGGDRWQVLRVGADFRLKCLTCGRVVMISRVDATRRAVEIFKEEDVQQTDSEDAN